MIERLPIEIHVGIPSSSDPLDRTTACAPDMALT